MRPVVCPTSPHLTPSPCISAQQISTILGAAVPEERENSAWTEGVAIWVAVLVVSLVGGWPRCGALALLAASCDRPCPCVCNPKALPGVLPVPWPALAALAFQRAPAFQSWHPFHRTRTYCTRTLIHLHLPTTPAGAFNDWNKDRQFQKLNAQKDIIEVKVMRGGKELTIPNHDVVVGDVMLLDTGDKIIADGFTIEVGGGR